MQSENQQTLPEILPEALEAAIAIQNESKRAAALSGMIPQLKSSSLDLSFWKESLHVLACCDRNKLLENISKLSSVIIVLGGSEALAQSGECHCRGWAAMALNLFSRLWQI